MQALHPLIHEQQLGNKLNHCVIEQRRADFALMLSMLTNDVREISEFQLEEQSTEGSQEIDWRKYFNLPKEQSLALSSLEQIDRFNQVNLIDGHREVDLRLQDALKSKPLAFRDDKKHIPLQVKANLDAHSLRKLEEEKESQSAARIGFSAKNWLNNLQQSVLNNQISLKDSVHSIA